MGTGTARTAAARGGCFWSVLDGCLADDGGRGDSSRAQPSQPPGEKSQDCGGATDAKPPVAGNGFEPSPDFLAKDDGPQESHAPELPQIPAGKKPSYARAAPATWPVPATATPLPRLQLGLERWGSPGESTARGQEIDAGSIPDPSRDSPAPLASAAIQRGAGEADPPAPQAPVPETPVPVAHVPQAPVQQASVPRAAVLEAPPQAPVPQAPVSEAHAPQAQRQQAPVPEAPVLGAYLKQAPVQQAPGQQAQGQQAAVPEAPVPEAPAPDHDPLAEPDLTGGPGAATPEATGELAFGARLFSAGPVSPSGSAADAGAGRIDRSARAGNENTQPDDSGLVGTAREGNTAASGHAAADSQNSATHGDARSAVSTPEGQAPTAARREAGPLAGPIASIPPKGGVTSADHPTGDGGDNPPLGQPVMESVWSPRGPSSAGAESPAPGQEANVARPAEAEPAEPAAQPATRDVSLHLADGDSSVDIRMAERAGEIRVTVHTPDRDLANSLRADLPDLVGKLRQNGFEAEAWRPATQPDANRRNGSDGSPSQEHSPGARKDGRQHQPQPPRQQDRSRWAGEWKSSLDPAQEPPI